MVYFFEGKILITYIAMCIIFAIAYTMKLQKKDRFCFAFFFLLFGIYIYYVINLTQFPIYQSPGMKEVFGENLWKSINLIPFRHIVNLTSLYNIIMMLPMGFLFPFLCRKRMSGIEKILVIIIPGVLIESMQLIQAIIIGYTLRVIDINDIICNAAGVLLGYISFCIFRLIIKNVFKKGIFAENYLVEYVLKR